MAIDAGGIYAKLVLDVVEWKNNLKKAEEDMEKFSGNMKKTGDKMEEVGKKMSLKVTAPLVAMGTAATKAGMDFQAGMSEVQAISGATGEDLAKLEAKAKEMGATTKFSASESAEALKYMAMAGWKTSDMLDGLEGIMMLAAASGEDLALTSDIVTDSLTAFGMEAKDASRFADLLASASSNSNTNVAMLGESFKYVAPLFGALGYSAEDAALALGLMANSGIKGSQAGTSLRAAITRLTKPTGEAAKAINELGIKTTDAEGNMLPFRGVLIQLREKFAGLTEEQQAQYAATIFGQEAMSGMLAIINASDEDFNKLTEATRDYNGVAKEMAEIMEDNLQGRIKKLKSALEGLALQIFELMLPSLEKFVEWLQKVVDWLSGLDEGTKMNIIRIGAMVAAIGPLLIVGGKFANGLGNILGLFAKLTPAAGAATTATSALGGGFNLAGMAAKAGALLLNPWTIGIGAATAGGIALAKYLREDSIPAINLFSDEISKSTQEAVGSFLELEEKATKSFNQLSWSGQEVTGEMVESIVGNFEEMKEKVVVKLGEQKEEAIKSLDEMFSKSKDMSEEEKKEILKITEEKYDNQIRRTEEGSKRIKEILERAKRENRAITDEERKEINKIKEEMKNTGIRILSESEKEQLAIMERLRQESGKISARQVADIVKNSKEQKEKTIAEAEKEYQERLKYAAELRAEGSEESKKLADKVAKEAKRQRDEAVKNAEEMHRNVVNEAKAQAKEHANQIDWEAGEVKSRWQRLKDWFKNNPIVRFFRTEDDGGVDKSKNVGRNALGTSYWHGGLTWVGEQGPELIELPKGSKVYSNEKSRQIIREMGSKIVQNIHIHSPEPLSASEIARKNLQVSRQLAMEWGL